jgi:hypothetical protein
MTGERLRWGGGALAALSQKERVTEIEPALSAWESVLSGVLTRLNLRAGRLRVTVKDRSSPGLMAC